MEFDDYKERGEAVWYWPTGEKCIIEYAIRELPGIYCVSSNNLRAFHCGTNTLIWYRDMTELERLIYGI